MSFFVGDLGGNLSGRPPIPNKKNSTQKPAGYALCGSRKREILWLLVELQHFPSASQIPILQHWMPETAMGKTTGKHMNQDVAGKLKSPALPCRASHTPVAASCLSSGLPTRDNSVWKLDFR